MNNKLIKYLITISLCLYCLISSAMTFDMPKHEDFDELFWYSNRGNLFRVYASGDIDDRTSEDFINFIKKNNLYEERVLVYFNSSGGSLLEGMKLGRIIREIGGYTEIGMFKNNKTAHEGICASACAYAFAGGVARYYTSDKTKLGLHQFNQPNSENESVNTGTIQKISGILVSYLTDMGVDALAFSISTKASPNEIIWLNKDEALKLNFANNGKQPTTAELKLVSKMPYLKIEQVRAGATGRFLFYCINKKITLYGGFVTSPEIAANHYEWATQSYLALDGKTVQLQKKDKYPELIKQTGSTIFVIRELSQKEIKILLMSNELGAWVTSEGIMAYGALADITNVQDNIRNFIKNCY